MTDSRLPDKPVLGLLFRLLHAHHAREIDAALRKAGFGDIRPHHANVFPFVGPDGIQIGELADLALVRKQTMAQAVDELERAGYVERRPDPSDRRAKLVFLTEKGKRVSPVSRAAAKRVEDRWAKLIGRAEIEHLRSALRELFEQLQ